MSNLQKSAKIDRLDRETWTDIGGWCLQHMTEKQHFYNVILFQTWSTSCRQPISIHYPIT